MPLHLTMDAGVDLAAKKWLAYQDPQMTPARREQILRVTKYNLLVTGFNASTALLVTAVVSSVLFSFQMAFVLGAIGLFTRILTEREIRNLRTYAIPAAGPADEGHMAVLARVAWNVIGGRAPVGNAILAQLGARQDADWEENEVIFDVYPLWKNRAPMPAAAAPVAPAPAAAG
ncbi:MAG TPA: hypothetical protein VLF94_04650 [Chlamydiales bacterium]|nr:hypothetical protein [Chlamydiales bacterium]